MTSTDFGQRLTAIVAADAAGYSRLMAADEPGTVAALDAALAEPGGTTISDAVRGAVKGKVGATPVGVSEMEGAHE